MDRPPPSSTLFPYTTLFRSIGSAALRQRAEAALGGYVGDTARIMGAIHSDRKSTRLNSSHEWISYAVFCLKKKKYNLVDRSRYLASEGAFNLPPQPDPYLFF